MTAIAGLVHGGRVYLAGDSAGVSGYGITIRKDVKVFRNGSFVFGFTSSFRMGQLLHHAFDPPEPSSDLERFMTTTFVDSLRACLKDGGWASKDADQERGGTFLVGVSSRLFRVASDYQVGESATGYDAVGAGEDLALGALHATEGLGLLPKQRLRLALTAAETHNGAVRSPFNFVSVGAP